MASPPPSAPNLGSTYGGASGGKAPAPIGVDPKFQAQVQSYGETPTMGDQGQLQHTGNYVPEGQTAVPPRYHAGDEFLPAGLPPESIAQLQHEMISAGLLKPNGVLLGRFDNLTQSAYKKLLGLANQSGQDVVSTLKTYMTMEQQVGHLDKNGNLVQGNGATQAVPGPLPIQLTNDNDLKATFRNAAMNLQGKNLTDSQTQAMIQAYHAIQTWDQTQAANLNAEAKANAKGIATPNSGQTVTMQNEPTAANFADEQIRQQHPDDVMLQQAAGQGGAMDAFNSLLSQWNKS